MNENEPITILLVDDHQIILDGLRKLLQENGNFQVVGEAREEERAMELIEKLSPQVVVIDVTMQDMAGMDTCRRISERYPASKILVLTNSTSQEVAIDAVAAGATGYLQKFVGINEILETTSEVAQGHYRIPDETLSIIFRTVRRHSRQVSEMQLARLSLREQEMLALYALGQNYNQIAETRGLSPHTVRNAIYGIQEKLGATSKQEIVVWAVQKGLLDSHTADPNQLPA